MNANILIKRPRCAAIGRWRAIMLLAAGMQTVVVPSLRAAATEKEIPDSGITNAVEDALITEKGVIPDDLNVSTSQGIVTLSGAADNLLAKERAVKIAECIRGVRGVIDRTAVAPVARPDEAIRKDILTALLQDPATDSYQVAVSVKGAVATLTGSVGSYAGNRLAARVAEGVKGIKEVINDIKTDYLAKRTDVEIDADIKARLQWDIWINGALVNTAVKDGKVTLTGTVGSAIAKSRAFDDAWLNGVVSVDDSALQVEPWAGEEARQKFKYSEASDAEIMKAVVASLRLDPRVSAFSPDVTVEGGVVILGGVVGNLEAKTAAEEDAKNIVGVWQTDDLLKVRPKGISKDAEMDQQLKAALLWDPMLNSATIDVAVINRLAYLSGSVESNFQKAEAQDVASRINGVVAVRNHLKVEADFTYYAWPYYAFDDWPYNHNRSAYVISESFGPQPYLSDEQIKKKIESGFFWSPFVERNDITVTVDGGVATLAGTVGSWMGWREADKDARKSGAGDVINHVKVKKGIWSWL